MPNYFFYGILAFIGLCLLGYTFWRIPNRRNFALYTFVAGSTYLLEYVIMVLLNSYVYHPRVLDDKYFDNILGAIISDAFSVPIVATFIGVFQLNLFWIVIIIGTFLVIELVFIKLNLYTHHWWSLSFTGVGLFFCFLLAKKWNNLLRGELSLFVRSTTLYFTNILMHATTGFMLFAFFHLFLFEVGWFQENSRDHVAFYGTYVILLPLLFTYFVVFRIKWSWRIGVLLLLMTVDWQFEKWGILQMNPDWNLVYFFLLRIVILWLLECYDKIVLQSKR